MGLSGAGRRRDGSEGFVLVLALLLLLGIGVMAVTMVYNAHHAQVTSQNYKNRIRAFYAADGVRSLLAQEAIDGHAGLYQDSLAFGHIEGEVWNGAGFSLDALRASLGTPPSRREKASYLGSYWKDRSNYGVRWSGLLVPPVTGPYTFFLRVKSAGAFYLSEDETPAKLSKDPIAQVAIGGFHWPGSGTGVSSAVTLKMGHRYYFEFLHAERTESGYGQVGWKGPDFLVEFPIPGKRLSERASQEGVWDTVRVAKAMVRYSLSSAGFQAFSVNTEGVLGGPGDTAVRVPLHQTLNLRGRAMAPPESLWQRVLYYDFHSDKSNPEFNRGVEFWPDGKEPVVHPGMVRTKGLRYTSRDADYFGLDSIGKPFRGPNPWRSCGVERWFTPWRPGWFKTYAYAGGRDDCTESNSPADTAFRNVVVRDSLLFRRRPDLGTHAYQFKRHSSGKFVPAFAPLDGRGMGNDAAYDAEGNSRNFSFCMELHGRFEHTSGLKLEFDGDDDVWVFINDSLVIDMGYVHQPSPASVNLDDLPLAFGEIYNLDFFYCERQEWGSSIDLVTNLPLLRGAGKPASTWQRQYGDRD